MIVATLGGTPRNTSWKVLVVSLGLMAVAAGLAAATLTTELAAQGRLPISIWIDIAHFPSSSVLAPPPRSTLRADVATAARGAESAGSFVFDAAQTIGAGASVPFAIGDVTVLVVDLSYRHLALARADATRALGGPAALHAADVGVTLNRVFSVNWSGLIRAGLGVASDFAEGLVDARLEPTVLALFDRTVGAHWTLSLGAAYAPGSGVDYPIPLVGAAWTDGARWQAELSPLTGAEAWYGFGGVNRLGFKASVESAEYRTPHLFPVDDARVQRIGITMGPSVSVQVLPGANLDLSGGVAVQSYRSRAAGASEADGDFAFERSPFFRTTLRLAW